MSLKKLGKVALDIACSADWIRPVASLVDGATHVGQKSWAFQVKEDSKFVEGTLRKMLAEMGVRSWGFLTTGRQCSFNVPIEDADKVYKVLIENGAQIASFSKR